MNRLGLMARAQRSAKLSDFGEWSFEEGLRRFVEACDNEANLSLFGYFGTRWDIRRLLSNLLRLRYEETRQPEILNERIERPIFITGLPRSGTTFLHQLLSLDEDNVVPRIWQAIYPYPDLRGNRASEARRQRVDRQLRMFRLLNPEFRRMHPVNANSPQECSEITAHVFASLRFDTTYTVPSYREWLDRNGHLHAYLFHKRFLQHLQPQARRGRRWVLKCPDHIFALDEIRAVYPDARIVFVHRDPVRVLASGARLTEVLRRPFTRRIDRPALGQQEYKRWFLGTELMLRAAEYEPFAEPVLHICYRDLVAQPLATVSLLYRHFELSLDPQTACDIARFVAGNGNGGYGSNRYSLQSYGIDPCTAYDSFSRYMTRFGITRESNAEKHS